MALTESTARDLPAIDQTVDAQVRTPLVRQREELQRLLGFAGDKLDSAVTWRQLRDQGYAILSGINRGGRVPPGSLVTPPGAGAVVDEPDLTPPPDPTGLSASGGFSHIIVEWDPPLYTVGHGHKRTNVYAVKRPIPDPNPPPVFGDAALVSSEYGTTTITVIPSEANTHWHLWIKWESVDGVESVNPAGGLNGVTVDTGQDITQMLNALTAAALKPTSAYTRTVFRADLFAIAPKADFYQEATPTGTVAGQLWFKPSTGVTKTWDGSAWQAFSTPLPFAVNTVPIVEDGVTIPPGVYMDAAYIRNLNALVARLGTAVIDDAKIASLSAAKILAGSLSVGQYIESVGYTAGPSGVGYRLTRTTIELPSTAIRGLLTASQIDSRGLNVKRSDGSIVLYADASSPPWVVNGSNIGGGIELTTGVSATNTMELRSIEAGDGMTISITTGGAIRFSSKSSDDSAIVLPTDASTSGTSIVDVDGMLLPLEANTVYRIEGTIKYRAAAASTGLTVAGTLPSTAQGIVRVAANVTQTTLESLLLQIPTGGGTYGVTLSATWAATAAAPSTYSSSADAIATVEGIIVTGADAGSFKLGFASEVSGSSVTIKAGTELLLERVRSTAVSGTYGLAGSPGFPSTFSCVAGSIIGKPRTAGVSIVLDGSGGWTIQRTGSPGHSGTATASGSWSSPTGSGAGAQWQVQFVTLAVSEASIGNGASSFVSLTESRAYSASVQSSMDDPAVTDTVTVQINLRNVASGAVTTLATIDLSVTASTD